MGYNLIKAERFLKLREVWPNEAHHFTHWIASEDTLMLLSSEIGLKGITKPQCEVKIAGGKSIDIVAEEKDSGKEVIIENKLEPTNHDHLGKIVTYSAGRHEAAIVIWIVAKATDEHRKAVDWLNSRTDNKIDFYLVEIQLWTLDNENLFPRFNVIVRPAPKRTTREYTDKELFFINFWTEFNKYADCIPLKFFSPDDNFNTPLKPHPENSYDLHIIGKKNLYVCIIVRKKEKYIKTGIYIPNDKIAFNHLYKYKEEISKKFGSELEWNKGNKKSSSVFLIHQFANIESVESQNELFEWICEKALVWRDVIKEYC